MNLNLLAITILIGKNTKIYYFTFSYIIFDKYTNYIIFSKI